MTLAAESSIQVEPVTKKTENEFRKKGLALRELVLQRAQSEHLLSALCPLDDILIEPHLMGKPYPLPPDAAEEQIPLSYSLIPYTPDLPHISSRLPFQSVPVVDAVNSAKHMAILAPGGHGKSVALAALASRYARNRVYCNRDYTRFPFYFHAADISTSNEQDPLITLADIVSTTYTQDTRFIRSLITQTFDAQEAILLVDGLDELDLITYERATAFLIKIKQAVPAIPIITTLSPANISILPEAGFALAGLSFWKPSDYQDWLDRWIKVWKTCADPHSGDKESILHLPDVVLRWLPDPVSQPPLEWSLMVWGFCSNDLSGQSLSELVLAYMNRVTAGCLDIEKWSQAARKMIGMGKITCDSRSITSTFNQKIKPAEPNTSSGSESSLQNSSQYLGILQNNGLLKGSTSGEFRFIHYFIPGFLAGLSSTENQECFAMQFPHWELKSLADGLCAIRNNDQDWLSTILKPIDTVFYFPTFLPSLVSLQSFPSQWKGEVFKHILSTITRKDLPLSMRCRLIPFFWKEKPAHSEKLFQSLLANPSSEVRRIALIGLVPYTKSQQVIDSLKPLLSDPDPAVRLTAMAAYSSSPLLSSLEFLMDTLIAGTEVERLYAAECLANRPHDGYSVLKETLQVEDLLIKRAGVFGLSQVREDWSQDLLSSTSILDGEWLVKNAASQALEVNTHPLLYLPVPQVHPSQAAWLIEFAGRQGRGIPAGSIPVELLMQAASSQDTAIVHQALEYLAYFRENGIQQLLQNCSLNENFRIQDHAGLLMVFNKLRGVN